MNNIFNLRRFSSLTRDLFVRRGLEIVITLLLICGLNFLIFYYTYEPTSGSLGLSKSFFHLSTIIYLSVLIMLAKDTITVIKNKSHYILVPNSTTEKWLFDIVFLILFPIILMMLCFKILANVALSFIVESVQQNDTFTNQQNSYNFISNIGYLSTMLILGIWTLLGMYYKDAIKPSLLFFGIITVAIGTNTLLNAMFFGNNAPLKTLFYIPFTNLNLENNHFQHNDYLLNSGFTDFQIDTYILLPITLLSAAIYYFKLKELEV